MSTSAATAVTQTFPNEFARPNITAPDADASVLPGISLSPGLTFRLNGSCDRPNATLALRLYLLDSNGRVITVQVLVFTTSAAPDWGAVYQGVPSMEPWFQIGWAKVLVMKVDSVTAGSKWDLVGAWSP